MAIDDIYAAVIERNKSKVAEMVQAELDAGTDISSILNKGLIAPMDEVGQKFSEGTLFIPEMLLSAVTMKTGLDVLKPVLSKSATDATNTIIIGTVKGDLHDVGKNLVAMVLEGGGFKVIDLGVDVGTKKFIEAVREHDAKIVGLSALLTTTMAAMEQSVRMLKKEGLGIKIMVGGAPVTRAFAEKIGADGYGEDGPGAVTLAREYIGKNNQDCAV